MLPDAVAITAEVSSLDVVEGSIDDEGEDMTPDVVNAKSDEVILDNRVNKSDDDA